MSASAPAASAGESHRDGLVGVAERYLQRVRAGDVGSLPVILGMVLITIFFTVQSSVFFTAVNFNNLIVQMAGTTVLAMGIVFVLLLGEIDLSIAYVSGVAGVTCAWLQQPGTSHQVPGIVAIIAAIVVGAIIGGVQGSFVAFLGVPSFVVTLAGLLLWQGVIIRWIGSQGVIGIQDNLVNDVANYVLPDLLGWVFAALLTAGFAVNLLLAVAARKRTGLPDANPLVTLLSIVFVGIVAFGAIAISNSDRGVPFAGVLVVVLLIFWTFIAQRTTFGRHVYAVGGNAEAARRAGINVRFTRIVCFMICSGMAGLGGVVLASRLNSVDLTAGSGTLLLDAIAAAVIGGTSLFGGRGRIVSALLGSLVIATINNGLSLIGSSAATQYMTTGLILLAAVTLDTVSRRRLAASGR